MAKVKNDLDPNSKIRVKLVTKLENMRWKVTSVENTRVRLTKYEGVQGAEHIGAPMTVVIYKRGGLSKPISDMESCPVLVEHCSPSECAPHADSGPEQLTAEALSHLKCSDRQCKFLRESWRIGPQKLESGFMVCASSA